MTHTKPIVDAEGDPISVGDLVEFDGMRIYGRVTALHPEVPSVAVRWFSAVPTEHTNPVRLRVVMGDIETSQAVAQAARCGWLAPCPNPVTRPVDVTMLGQDVRCEACVLCGKIMQGPQRPE